MQPTTPQNTKPDQNVKHGSAEACKSGEPLLKINSIAQLCLIESKFNVFRKSNKMTVHQWTVLLAITGYWVANNGGMSMYAICNVVTNGSNRNSVQVTTAKKVADLLVDGHIEIVGKGHLGARLYAPSVGTMNALAGLIAR